MTVNEGSGTATITATVDNAPETDLVITLSNGETITIASGQLTGTSTPFDIQGDDVYVDGEDYVVSISETSGGNFEDLDTSDTALVTIEDTVDTTTVTLGDVTVDEGSGTATITATVDNAPETDLVITLSNGETITIASGQLTGTSTPFDIQGDDVYVDGEDYVVSISETSGGNFEDLDTSDTALVTIEDTVDTTTVSITGDASVIEGDPASYTISLSNPADGDVTVDIVYSGTAEDGSDFYGTATVTIPDGQDSYTLNLATIDDNLSEGTENVVLTLQNPTGGNFENLVVSPTQGSIDTLIYDNDASIIASTGGSLYEAALYDGSGADIPAGAGASMTGTFTVSDPGDIVDAITVTPTGGSTVSFDTSGGFDTLIGQTASFDLDGDADNDATITIDSYDSNTGTFTYTVELTDAVNNQQQVDPTQQADDLEFSLTFGLEDGSSTIASASADFNVVDDEPRNFELRSCHSRKYRHGRNDQCPDYVGCVGQYGLGYQRELPAQ